MPSNLLNSPLLGLVLTIVTFRIGEFLAKRLETNLLQPFVTSSILIMLTIYLFPSITYKEYEIGGSIIAFLLGPATVALALPLFKQWQLLKENISILLGGAVVAATAGLLSIIACLKIFGASEKVALSLIAKSVTAPIALEITKTLGGLPSLTIACTVLSGILGAIIGHKLLAILGVKNDVAIGMAMGAASHGIGATSCIPISAVQVAFCSLAIALVGITTALFAPIFVKLLM